MDDDDNDSEAVRKHKRKRRMMRLLHAQGLRKLNGTSHDSPYGNPYKGDISSRTKNLNKDASENHFRAIELKSNKPQKAHPAKKKPCPPPIEDDDYLLESIHFVKAYITRFWKWALCYTQYCYPGLRTIEYYKKVQAKHDRKKKKESKKKGDPNKKGERCVKRCSTMGRGLAAGGANCCSLHSDPNRESASLSDLYVSDEDHHHDHDQGPSTFQMQNLVNRNQDSEVNTVSQADDAREYSKTGWGESTLEHIKEASPTMAYLANSKNSVFRMSFFKWMCILLAPVFLLGIHYVILKRKYSRLASKLKRSREENDSLVEECHKLETIMSNTEKIEMPFSTKEEREEVVAEFTRLAESRMKSKKELVHMSTKKAALQEELKMAKKQRDQAREQYQSVTSVVMEASVNNRNHLQAAV